LYGEEEKKLSNEKNPAVFNLMTLSLDRNVSKMTTKQDGTRGNLPREDVHSHHHRNTPLTIPIPVPTTSNPLKLLLAEKSLEIGLRKLIKYAAGY